ncbi:hypothetical protein DDZ16_04385 [Marinilabilia rubra]|uniref:Uncharacterized protein n=2 Tax=Marinilabilia rubra TaxID=2162893 RepID=A0A2U2BCN3_9BACT|nr:hypothetical protein DDZ16_04385 [Marinilabilia rubra]
MNKALELEKAGLITEAADLYLRSLQANDDNIDSKLGLKRTGQVVLDQKSDEFMAFYRNKQYKEAVYAFLDVEKYHGQVKSFGINLDISENVYSYYQEVKDTYLNEQYGKAINALNTDNFENALSLFDEILKIAPNYRDATKHRTTARYEPVYREGLNFLKTEKNRKAYYAFDEILKNNGEYKEASTFQSEAREKALIRIGIIPFSSYRLSQKNIADEIRTYITSQISRLNSPFYEVVKSTTMNNSDLNYNLLRKLLLNKYESAPRIPSNIDAVLSGKIKDYSSATTPLKKTRRKAWLKESKTLKKEDGTEEKVTEYRKVYYYEYTRKSNFNLSLSYTLTHAQNKSVMVSDVVDKKLEDQVKYAEFDGDHRKLVPGIWYSLTKKSQLDKVYDTPQAVKELHATFESRKELNDSGTLKKQALAELSDEISQKIINYNPEI